MVQLCSRAVVLLTGMSGTKSTALAELSRRGHRVIDTDDPGWITQVETVHGVEPVWDAQPIRELLEGHRDGWLFIGGCVANQAAFYDRLDAVVPLSAPVGDVLARVTDRANPFGAHPEQRAKIAADLAQFEPVLSAGADYEIDATAPVSEVVAVLEQLATEVQRPADTPR